MLHLLNPIASMFHWSTRHLNYDQAPTVGPLAAIAPNSEYSEPGRMKEYPGAQKHPLPSAEQVPLAVGEAIARRRSCRQFAETSLPLAALSTLLRDGYGLGDSYVQAGQTMF